MRVKIKEKIYDSENIPIMLILSDKEKKLIGNMIPENHKFCSFHDKISTGDIKKFMKGNFNNGNK